MKTIWIALMLIFPALAQAQLTPGQYIEIPKADGGGTEIRRVMRTYTEEFTHKEKVILDKGPDYDAKDLKVVKGDEASHLAPVNSYDFLVTQAPGRTAGTIRIARLKNIIMRTWGGKDPLAYVVEGELGPEVLQPEDLKHMKGKNGEPMQAEILPASRIPGLINAKKNYNVEIGYPTIKQLDDEGTYFRPESRATLEGIIASMEHHPNYGSSKFHLEVVSLYKQTLEARMKAHPDSFHHGEDLEMLDLVNRKELDPNKVQWTAQQAEDFKAAARKAAQDISIDAHR
jgi:hypothetical protein